MSDPKFTPISYRNNWGILGDATAEEEWRYGKYIIINLIWFIYLIINIILMCLFNRPTARLDFRQLGNVHERD